MAPASLHKLAGILLVVTSGTAVANVVGTDLQNFNASVSGVDYVTVQSAEALEPGIFHLGLMTNYAVNTLPIYEDESETQNRLKADDSLLTSEILIGVGLWEDLEAGVAASRLMRQSVDDEDVPHGQLSGPGWTNYRFHLKYKVWQCLDSRGGWMDCADCVGGGSPAWGSRRYYGPSGGTGAEPHVHKSKINGPKYL